MRLHRAGHRILLVAAAVGVALYGLIQPTNPSRRVRFGLATALLVVYGMIAAFFRIPARYQFPTRPSAILSPAQGKVVAIERVHEGEFLGRECNRVSIYLSLLDMHMSTAPLTGRIVRSQYDAGQYLLAFHPKASELNERHSFVIETPDGVRIMVRLIAGTIARRICPAVVEGQTVEQGDELGFIKFGSRVDVFLPPELPILVRVGERVRLGVSPIARRI